MTPGRVESIKLNSAAYDRLSLNEKIAVFNREVHQFEDEQQRQIATIWEKINTEYIDTGKLSALRSARIKNGFAQAFVNLQKMMTAETLYEAELYRQSYIKALELVKTPRRRFIMLQSQSLGLAHDAADVKAKIAEVEKELLNLKSLYSTDEQAIFDNAHRELTGMMQIKDAKLFASKKKQFLNSLADIHERAHQRTIIEKSCEEDIEKVIERGQAIFNARSSYLEDKNHWMSRASNIAEKSWVGAGVGLGAVAVLTVVGAVLVAPVTAFALGVVGAGYGAVDLARTVGSTVTKETTAKLGEREITNPKQSWKDKAKNFAKKAIPIALCVAGVALGVAAIIATGGVAGIALAVAGIAITAIGVGQMAYEKYQERKEILEMQQQHKEINESFDSRAEELLHKIQTNVPDEDRDNSIKEEMRLLAGHKLTAKDIESMKTAATLDKVAQQQKEANAIKDINKKELEVSKDSLDTVPDNESEEGEGGEAEGGATRGDNIDSSKDDDKAPTLIP